MAENKRSNREQTTTMKRSQNKTNKETKDPKTSNKETQSTTTQKSKAKAVASRNKDVKQKSQKGKNRGGRAFMLTLMAAYVVVMLIAGGWAFQTFFAFLFVESSPVMGINTDSSRVKDTPDLGSDTIKKGIDAIKNAGYPIDKVEVTQVGPSLHFYVVVAPHVELGEGRDSGRAAIIAFADAIGQPELYATYEAQIIVTKAELPKLTEEEILRPAAEEGNEQAFPQYGVSNKHTGGAEKNVSWSNNGV